ncbi:hypothetical protein PV733_35570 [Streptomyces europaeiscabiei]|uniref:hypothetical protein n=1 Tax=Streptomyces europaeiscabiei TaxID=146819 RepID=UPI0029B56258|nr:hypothetical protein [Streptomyces europaeiscabiei]MDX2762888.1 hypothetical protein [Streptomyces europaeiscabiei]MDX3714162.1 hypothetical protein [Streptomyces europaeiscabiei]MDX3836002.1 hypothetical protein [Streptomyces europaeiscabiei]
MVNATNLLPYEPSTDPKPLRVSSAEETEYGSVNINVGGGITTSAWCNKITVRVPVGAGAEHLTTEGADIKTGASTGWTPSAPTVSGGFAVITFTPARAVQFTGQIVTLTLSNIAVNRTAGQVSIAIVESSSRTDGSFTNKDAAVEVDKFPAGFVFRNFAPEKIMVENGEVAVLRWEGSDAKYTMHWGDTPAGVSLDKERVWPTPRGLTTVTGFMLRAEVTAGGVTLTHTLTTAVTVRIPDLVVRNLTVQGPATFADSVSLSNTAKDLTVAGSVRGAGSNPLRVSQNAGLKVDAVLNVTGASTFNGDVTANGAVAAVGAGKFVRIADLRGPYGEPLKINSHVNVLPGNNVTITDNLTANGNIKAGGNRVLRAGDTLRFVGLSSKYLTEDYDYGGETTVVKTFRTLYLNANWRAQHISSASSFREEPEGMQEPEALAQDERTVTPDPEL